MTTFRNVLMCDQIYMDRISNKAVIAGVYTGDITCPVFPIGVRFAIYAELIPSFDGDAVVDLEYLIERKKFAAAKVGFTDLKAGVVSVLVLPNTEIGTEAPCLLQVKASINHGRSKMIIEKRLVALAPPAT